MEFLAKHLGADNAFMLLTQARLFDEPQLASLCLDTIDKSTVDAISAEGLTDIDIDTLCAVLGRDTLSIREKSTFWSCCTMGGSRMSETTIACYFYKQTESSRKSTFFNPFPTDDN